MKKILITLTVILLMAKAYADESGTCGDNATWTFNETTGVLTISGTEMMKDYSYSSSPFYSLRNVIKQVVIQEGITSIGRYAFYYCSRLTSISIPNSVTSIGGKAFSGCEGLTVINIPNSVSRIGDEAFSYCSGLNKVCINSIEAWCNIEFSDASSNPLHYAHNLYLNDELVTYLTIPNSVSSICNCAFSYCSGLKRNHHS